jgi:biotin carboxyl carrier protein
METYVQEPMKYKEEQAVQEKDEAADTLNRDMAAFVGSYLKEMALALGESQVDGLSVSMDDITVKMLKKQRGRRRGDERSAPEESPDDRTGKPVISHYLGIFHILNSKKAPYVSVGDRVKKGQVLARIETMNIWNDIKAARDGVITDILEEEGKPVEYGQMLFLLDVE